MAIFPYRLALFFVLMCWFTPPLFGQEICLRDNLQQAQPGDFIVIAAGKTDTLMLIQSKQNQTLTIEEIAVPENRKPPKMSWKEWVQRNAPGNTSWVVYDVDLRTGRMIRYFSFTKKHWFDIPDADNFLSKLLNLRLSKIPDNARKKVGPPPTSGPDLRPLWQPRMIVNGQPIKNVHFDAWRTRWPQDGGDLSGKVIEVYLPRDSKLYPAYFPYWLQINGAIGKAKIRIIDSGVELQSPKPTMQALLSPN